MSAKETADRLSIVPLFKDCSARQLRHIASRGHETTYPAGRTITEQGKLGDHFFVILEGRADVKQQGRSLRRLGEGDFLGEIALVTKQPRTATVTTASPVRALVITDRDFRTLLKKSPAMQLRVLEALAERLPPETL